MRNIIEIQTARGTRYAVGEPYEISSVGIVSVEVIYFVAGDSESLSRSCYTVELSSKRVVEIYDAVEVVKDVE